MERREKQGDIGAAVKAPPAASLSWVEQIDVPAQPQFVAHVRRRLVRLLEDSGFSSLDASDLAVAVSEAISNAIEHAAPGTPDPVVIVRTELSPSGAHVVVSDRGSRLWDPGAVPEEADPVGDFENVRPDGRGLAFMKRLTDEFAIGTGVGGTEVHLVKRRR